VFAKGAWRADELIRRTQEALRERLPPSMMPSSIVRIEAIPVSHNGKADVARLVALAPEAGAQDYVAAATAEEREVASLMAQILGVERVGVTDDFFSRGGTSLLAIAFVTKYAKIGLQQFYANPTVRGVLGGAAVVERRLARIAPRTGSNVVVLFVPYGGGNVFVYNDIATAMRRAGSTANIITVDVPRSDETLEEVASEIAGEMEAEGLLAPSTRIVLFGHCVGSALATAIGLEVQRRGKRIEALVAGGYIPGLPPLVSLLERQVQRFIYRSDRRIKWFMRNIGFHNAAALEELDVRPMLEDFRVDGLRAREFYGRERDERLRAELHLLLGERDPLTRHIERYHAGWRRYVTGGMSVLRIGGAKHYFVHEEAALVARFLNGVVAEHETRVAAEAGQAA
jgi:surfactin synthase thioesterase subunit